MRKQFCRFAAIAWDRTFDRFPTEQELDAAVVSAAAARGAAPPGPLISTHISRASAGLLLVGGLALLFAADDILPRLIPAFPASGGWIGQLLAAAWLAVATLNWLSRSSLLGGIYGRPVVLTNAILYFVGTMVLLEIVMRSDAPAAVGLLAVPFALLAALYSWLLFRGPLERDFEMHRRSQPGRP